MTTTIDAPTLQKIRLPVHSEDIYLSIFRPKLVERGRLYLPDPIQGLSSDIADNYYIDHVISAFSVNTYGTVQKNQTIYFYGTDGKPLGRSRIRSKSGNNIYYQVSEQIPLSSGCTYQIMDYYELWPIFPRVVINTGTNTVTYYKDYDIPYNNQNLNFPPVPVFGPHFAGFVDDVTLKKQVTLDASRSYTVDGTTISNYFWTFPSGVTGTANSGAIVTGTFLIGQWQVKLDVVNNIGVTGTGYRNYIINSRPGVNDLGNYVIGETSYSNNNPPFQDWTLDSLNGDWDSGDWSCKITVGQNSDQFVEGSLVILWTENKQENTSTYHGQGGYTGTSYILNEIYAGNWPGRDPILFVGYVVRIDNRNSGEDSSRSILLKSVSGVLANKDMFSVSLESVTTPADWTQINNMTINKIINHYLRWHSNLLEVADFFKITSAPGDYYEQYEDIPRGQIVNNIRTILQNRVFGNICTNKQGQIYTEVNLNLLSTGTRPATTLVFNTQDWLDVMESTENFELPLSSVLLGGVGFDISIASGTAYLSKAPDAQFPAAYGKPETKSGLNITSQTESNLLSGLYFGWKNNEFNPLSMRFGDNLQFLDIVPQEFYKLDPTYPFGDTDTNRISLKTKWRDRRIIPRKINITQKDFQLQQEVVFESETDGKPGETIVIPVVTKNDPPSAPPPPGGLPPSGEKVWVVTQNRVGFTTNWSSSSPNYINKTGNLMTGTWTINDFVLDPHNSIYRACVCEQSEIFLTTTANLNSPIWTYELSATAVQTALGITGVKFCKACFSITQNLLIYVAWEADGSGGSGSKVGISVSQDYGGTWSHHVIVDTGSIAGTPGINIRRIATSHIAGNVIYAIIRYTTTHGNGVLYKSTNYGTTWIALSELPAGFDAMDWDISYSDSDVTQIIVGSSVSMKIYKSSDSGVSFVEKDSNASFKWVEHYYVINIATFNPDDIIAVLDNGSASSALVRSTTNGGTSWSTIATTDITGIQSMGRWPSDTSRVFWLSSTDIWYSTDRMATHLNKNGNWSTVFGGAFANPVRVVPSWLE